MPIARKSLVSLAITPYYHCTSRCVRGAYLCGKDKETNRSFKHRKRWLEKRLCKLANIFAIKLCSYAIMDNHFHVIVHINMNEAAAWSDLEVVQRWQRIFKGTAESQKYSKGKTLSVNENQSLKNSLSTWRLNLYNLGWFMRCVKEPLARKSNEEDECKGHFWECRYHSQALLDDRALAACMAYVDLNPVRAGICDRPQLAKYTSFTIRSKYEKYEKKPPSFIDQALVPCSRNEADRPELSLPFDVNDYLHLVEWTARKTQHPKPPTNSEPTPTFLDRHNMQETLWEAVSTEFEKYFYTMAGSISCVNRACRLLHKQRIWGSSDCLRFFGTG